MKVYISADMERITGVTHPEDVIPDRSQYERFRKLLTADVNAAIDGAMEAGASEFLVNEAHDGMKNILLEELYSRVEVMVGRSRGGWDRAGDEPGGLCPGQRHLGIVRLYFEGRVNQ
jgi:D-amino peptidase